MPNGEQIIPQVPLKQIDSNDIDKSSEKFIELYKDVYYEDSKKYHTSSPNCFSGI